LLLQYYPLLRRNNLRDGLAANLGNTLPALPCRRAGAAYPTSTESPSRAKHWATLEADAKKGVERFHPLITKPRSYIPMEQFPKLTNTLHASFQTHGTGSPAARGERDIVFLGYLHTGAQSIHASACALWSYAYLEDHLLSPNRAPLSKLLNDQAAMEKETVWINAWIRARYLGFNDGLFITTFETREVIDQVLKDLGIRGVRKGMLVKKELCYGWRCFFAEWFRDYGSAEYAGIVDEYLEIVGGGRCVDGVILMRWQLIIMID